MGISSLSCISLSTKVGGCEDLPLPSIKETEMWEDLPLGQCNYRKQGAVCSKVSLRFFTTHWSSLRCDDGACNAESSWCCENLCRAHLCRTALWCFGRGVAGLQIAAALALPEERGGQRTTPGTCGTAVQVWAPNPLVGHSGKETGVSGAHLLSS